MCLSLKMAVSLVRTKTRHELALQVVWKQKYKKNSQKKKTVLQITLILVTDDKLMPLFYQGTKEHGKALAKAN